MSSYTVKTLDLIVEYVFQLKAYIWYLIFSCSSLEDLVKVFNEVILERIDVNETLSSTLQGCPKTEKSTDPSE